MWRWLKRLLKAQPRREDTATTAALDRERRVRQRLMELTMVVDIERRDRRNEG